MGKINPESPYYFFIPYDKAYTDEYGKGWKINKIFPCNSIGIVTARDRLTIQWSQSQLWDIVKDFATKNDEEARLKYKLGNDAQDWQVRLAKEDINKNGLSDTKIRKISYRPFDNRFTYYTGASRGFICRPRHEVMKHMLFDNYCILTCRQIVGNSWRHGFVTNNIVDNCIISNLTRERSYCFPLYLYNDDNYTKQPKLIKLSEDEKLKKSNINKAVLDYLSNNLLLRFLPDKKGDLKNTFGPEDVFNYIYAVMQSPSYRSRYNELLRIDFPRIPFTSNKDLFRELCQKGDRLVKLHLLQPEAVNPVICRYPEKGDDQVERGYPRYVPPKDGQAGRVWINRKQYFEGVSPNVWEFTIGGYQVCDKWLKDRRGRVLSYDDLTTYCQIVTALTRTIEVMAEIDEVIEEHGGWPIE